MGRPIGDSLFRLPAAGAGHAAWRRVRLGIDGPDWKEEWLQDRVAQDPDLVLGACRAFGFLEDDEEWRLWFKEMPISGIGKVDVALVSADGRVALVEVKLARNPEIRREVVAQLLDYAIHLREVDLSELPALPLVAGQPFADAEDVQRHLRDGDFLLIVAADAADERAAKLTRAVLDRHAIHPWDLAIVDLALFAPPDGASSPIELVCVPHVIGGVQCESRHVVEVKVINKVDGASVVVRLAEPESVAGGEVSWNRETFRHAFTTAGPPAPARDLVFAWLEDAEATQATSIRYGRGKQPSALVTVAGQVFASADQAGIWIYGCERLKRAFGTSLGDQRWRNVRALFPDVPEQKQYFQVPATDTRFAQAIELVRRWTRS